MTMMIVMTVVVITWWGVKWRKKKYTRNSLKILPILLPPSPSAAIAPEVQGFLSIEAETQNTLGRAPLDE
jgi:hypothetical protein